MKIIKWIAPNRTNIFQLIQLVIITQVPTTKNEDIRLPARKMGVNAFKLALKCNISFIRKFKVLRMNIEQWCRVWVCKVCTAHLFKFQYFSPGSVII